jgi:CDP-paratose 2-epimerase
MSRRILVTGGAGFVGSSLALRLKRAEPASHVIAFDNLHRRGSELNLARLRQGGVEVCHGDVRVESDLRAFADHLDLVLECSAEPSVMAGRTSSSRYAVDTNLTGCVNCLELAKDANAAFIFLSTSRVYPVAALQQLRYETVGRRFQLMADQPVPGAGVNGISEAFPLHGVRTLYGATKLAAELLIAEYVDMYGLRAAINRCGVISGPWQMGHAEQGVFAFWMLSHVLRRPLRYIGFGGQGHQVRDVLHIDDLTDLVERQIDRLAELDGLVVNCGGGAGCSASLAEFTGLCEQLTHAGLEIGSDPRTRPGDVPVYVTDNRRVTEHYGWRPTRTVDDVAASLHAWIVEHRQLLETSLA